MSFLRLLPLGFVTLRIRRLSYLGNPQLLIITLNNKRIGRLLLIVTGFVTISCCACFGLLRAYVLIEMEAHQANIEQTAKRLGVEPTMWGIERYIVESIKPGMTRKEVEEILSVIAPIEVERGELEEGTAEWGPVACDNIILKLAAPLPVPGKWPMYACYDSQGGLVALHSSGDDLPPIAIYAP